eukprot:COSAG06_NODE_4957_length_3832_cov_14.437450_3_plen_91_part_00
MMTKIDGGAQNDGTIRAIAGGARHSASERLVSSEAPAVALVVLAAVAHHLHQQRRRQRQSRYQDGRWPRCNSLSRTGCRRSSRQQSLVMM